MFGRLMLLLSMTSVLGFGALPASAAQEPGAAATSAASPAAGPPSASSSPAITAVGAGYRLGAGDKIRVIVFGEEALSGEFFVGGGGTVSLPLIGEVKAAPLTIQEFQTEIETALRQGYLKEPRVNVEVLTYRPYYILGEVNKPGEYPYSNGLNVLNAVATAGGFTYRAQTKRVYIRHISEDKEQSYPLASDVPVAPGDTIRITERFF